jgi:hypothetical protein
LIFFPLLSLLPLFNLRNLTSASSVEPRNLLRKYNEFPLTLTLSLEGRGEGEGDFRL